MLRIVPHHSGTISTESSVRGEVVLDVHEAKSYKRIIITFVGKARISFEPRAGDTSTMRWKVTDQEYFVNHAIILWSKEESLDGQLAPGQYKWPFSFSIPPDAPSTFDGKFGSVSYTLQATIKTGRLRSNHVVEHPIRVKQIVNLSASHLFQPRCREVQKRVCCCCCASGAVVLNVIVPSTGLCIEETFTLRTSIENGSSRSLKLRAVITKQIVYSSRGTRREDKSVLVSEASNQIAARSTEEWNPSITIPNTETVNCRVIMMNYTLIISAILTAASNLTVSMPITLGTKRERQREHSAPQFQRELEFSTHSQHGRFMPLAVPYPADFGPHGDAPAHQFGDVVNPHPQYQYGPAYPPSGQQAYPPPPDYQYEPPPLPFAPVHPPRGLHTHIASVTMDQQ